MVVVGSETGRQVIRTIEKREKILTLLTEILVLNITLCIKRLLGLGHRWVVLEKREITLMYFTVENLVFNRPADAGSLLSGRNLPSVHRSRHVSGR